MTSSSDFRNETAAISKSVVSRVAPEELEFFDEIEAQFNRDPKRFTNVVIKDGPLQFGLHDTASLVTPAAIAATAAVFHYLLKVLSMTGSEFGKELGKAAGKHVTSILKQRLAQVRTRDGDKLAVGDSHLDHEVRKVAQRDALKHGVTETIANAIADEIVRTLRA